MARRLSNAGHPLTPVQKIAWVLITSKHAKAKGAFGAWVLTPDEMLKLHPDLQSSGKNPFASNEIQQFVKNEMSTAKLLGVHKKITEQKAAHAVYYADFDRVKHYILGNAEYRDFDTFMAVLNKEPALTNMLKVQLNFDPESLRDEFTDTFVVRRGNAMTALYTAVDLAKKAKEKLESLSSSQDQDGDALKDSAEDDSAEDDSDRGHGSSKAAAKQDHLGSGGSSFFRRQGSKMSAALNNGRFYQKGVRDNQNLALGTSGQLTDASDSLHKNMGPEAISATLFQLAQTELQQHDLMQIAANLAGIFEEKPSISAHTFLDGLIQEHRESPLQEHMNATLFFELLVSALVAIKADDADGIPDAATYTGAKFNEAASLSEPLPLQNDDDDSEEEEYLDLTGPSSSSTSPMSKGSSSLYAGKGSEDSPIKLMDSPLPIKLMGSSMKLMGHSKQFTNSSLSSCKSALQFSRQMDLSQADATPLSGAGWQSGASSAKSAQRKMVEGHFTYLENTKFENPRFALKILEEEGKMKDQVDEAAMVAAAANVKPAPLRVWHSGQNSSNPISASALTVQSVFHPFVAGHMAIHRGQVYELIGFVPQPVKLNDNSIVSRSIIGLELGSVEYITEKLRGMGTSKVKAILDGNVTEKTMYPYQKQVSSTMNPSRFTLFPEGELSGPPNHELERQYFSGQTVRRFNELSGGHGDETGKFDPPNLMDMRGYVYDPDQAPKLQAGAADATTGAGTTKNSTAASSKQGKRTLAKRSALSFLKAQGKGKEYTYLLPAGKRLQIGNLKNCGGLVKARATAVSGQLEGDVVWEAGASFTYHFEGQAHLYRKKDFRYDIDKGCITYPGAPPLKKAKVKHNNSEEDPGVDML